MDIVPAERIEEMIFRELFASIVKLMEGPAPKLKQRIGFHPSQKRQKC
jgi:hypothetical protein